MSERISLYQEKLDKSPGNILFRFSLAQAYYEEADYQNAIHHLKVCLNERKDWMMALLFLGKSLIASGQKTEAREILNQTITVAQDQGHEDPEEEAKHLLSECRDS
jgi:tetratricopeptide (TPR) repeat protein